MAKTRRSVTNYFLRALRGELEELDGVNDLLEGAIRRGFGGFGASVPEEDIPEFIDTHYDELVLHRDTYPSFLRGSLLVTSCSLVERELNSFARIALLRAESALSLEDFRGSGIKRAKVVLEKACGVDFPSNSLSWERIVTVHEMRSVVLHSGWEISGSSKPDKVRAWVEVIEGLELTSGGVISISDSFYPTHRNHLLAFFSELFKEEGGG